jgi:hypothetical protein
LSIGLTTLQRWRRQFAGGGDAVDCRKGSHRYVRHRLSEEKRQRILLTCNEPEFAALLPGQIVPILADRGLFIGSERSFYRVLQCHGQATAAGRWAKSGVEPGHHLSATTVRGVWLYLYLVIYVWSRLPGLGQRAGGTRWWPGMSLNEKTQLLQPI